MNLLLLLRQKLKLTRPRVPRITQAGFIRFTQKSLATYLIVFIAFSGTTGLFLFNPFGTKTADAAWFNDNWAYRKAITVTNGSSFTDRFVHFDIDTTDAPDKFQADCGDIRFTDSNNNILDYYYNTAADQCDNAGTDFYVNLNTILNGTMTIYMYYGNPSALNGYLEGDFQGADVVVDDIAYASEEKGPAPIAYWRFDEGQGATSQDSSSNNQDGTITNATWQTEDFCVSGKCLKFDGSGDYVDHGTDFTINSSFTISAWVKLNSNTVADYVRPIFAKGSWGDDSNGDIRLEIANNSCGTQTGSGQLTLEIQTSAGTACVSESTNAPENRWMHVSASWDGSNIKLYRDGLLVSSASLGGTLANNAHSTYIGAYPDNVASTTINGFIDEVKYYNQALSSAQILANYNSRSNPEGLSTAFGQNTQNTLGALSNGLVGYWKMDESSWTNNCSTTSVVDSSGNSSNGAACPNSTGPTGGGTGKFGNAGQFDGSNDYVEVADAAALRITGDITISAWIKPTAVAATFQRIVSKMNDSNNAVGPYSFFLNTNQLRYIRGNGTTNLDAFNSTGTVTEGVWTHIAVSQKGSTIDFYINGQSAGTSTATSAGSYSDSGSPMRIGSLNSGGQPFEGTIDETRIYNRGLSAAEIFQLYNFAPGPVGYWKMDEKTGTTAIDSSGNGFNGTLSSSSQWTNGKYGGAANFDGTQSLITTNGNSVKGLSQVTIEMWVRPTVVDGTQRTLYVECTTADCRARIQLDIYSTGIVLGGRTPDEVSFTSFHGTDGRTIAANTWYHIAAVFDSISDTHYVYINGIHRSTSTVTSAFTSTNPVEAPRFGHNWSGSSANFIGTLDEVKIYNYVRSSAQIIEDMNGGHPAPGSPVSSAVAHWKLDEGYGTSAQDYSGNSNTLTLSSATSAWTNSGKFNKAWNGDGALYLSRTDDSDFDVSATDDYSVSLWYKSDSATNPAATEYLFNKASASIAGYAIYSNTSGNLCFAIDDDTTWSPDVASCTTTDVYDATWHHIVAVRDVTQDKTYIYLDGNLADSDTDSTSATLANSQSLYVGDRDGTNNGDEFNGDLDEIKVYRSALTADQVKIDLNRSSSQVLGAVGASSNQQPQAAANEYCPPDSSATACTGPVGEWKFDEGSGTSSFDTSGNGNTGTFGASTAAPTIANGKFNKALRYDGTDDYNSVGAGFSSLNGVSAFTAEAWVNFSNSSEKYIMTSDNQFDLRVTTNNITFSVNTSGGFTVYRPTVTIASNTWNHIVGVYDGTNMSVYLNGKLVNSQPKSGTVSSIAVSGLVFGAQTSVAGFMTGILDQAIIYNYARTPAQIAWSYNKGGPVGWWKMDECQGTTIYDASGNGNNGTLTIGTSGSNTSVGTCQTSGAWYDGATGKRNYSIELDGTDDYLQIAHNSLFDFGSKDFTISLWTKFNAIRTQILLEKFTEPGGPGWSWYMLSSTQLEFFGCNNNTCQTATNTSAFTTGQWYHLMITRSGSTYTTYVNGKAIGTAINANDLTSSAKGITIGERDPSSAEQSFPLSAQVDDVRIYNYGLTATQANTLYNEGATRFGPTTGAP